MRLLNANAAIAADVIGSGEPGRRITVQINDSSNVADRLHFRPRYYVPRQFVVS